MRATPTLGTKAPLSSRSINIVSPPKSMILETKCDKDGSPWRIKVTVEAEPTSTFINRSVRTSKLPLRDAPGSSSPTKRPSRRSRKSNSSPMGRDAKPGPTPSRSRNNSVQTHDLIEIPDEPTNDYSLSEIEPAHLRSGSSTDASFHGKPVESLATSTQSADPHQDLTESAALEAHEKPSGSAEQAKRDLHDADTASPGFPAPVEWSDDEDDAVPGALAPGEITVLESEDFSMISVDSLSSNPRLNDHLSPAAASKFSGNAENEKRTDLSYMRSSPPTLPPYRLTPSITGSPSKYPAAPHQPVTQHDAVPTPLQESARKSGRALQNVLTGPFRESTPRHRPPRDGMFTGFSTGTRRQLRTSLLTGQGLAAQPTPVLGLDVQGAPQLATPAPNFSSPFQSPVRRNSTPALHRLPTPDDNAERGEQSVIVSPTDNAPNPSLISTLPQETTLASPYIGYDAMSWVATDSTRPSLHGATPPTLTTKQVETRDQVVHSEGTCADLLDEDVAGDDEDNRKCELDGHQDIWQEEASRSLEGDDTPPIMRDDLLVKPRRAKLPRTWRRTSGVHFNYSDSPEPEVINRKVSAATSASGIMTPPITEDERHEEQEPVSKWKQQNNEYNEVESSVGEGGFSPTGSTFPEEEDEEDDTGVFWQTNLPSVFSRSDRPVVRKARTDIENIAALKMDDSFHGHDKFFAPSSPLRNTMLDISPAKPGRSPLKMVPIQGGYTRSGYSDSILMPTPLRQSLLKSSKVKCSPCKTTALDIEKDTLQPAVDHSGTELSDPSSLASDARQLQNEFSQHLKSSRPASPVDFTQETLTDSSELSSEDASRSYVEDLNRASPVRIKVNFNDSSVAEQRNASENSTHPQHDDEGRSVLLSPKKSYPPLFNNVPSLKPSSVNGAPDDSASSETSSGRPKVREGGFVSRLTESFWDAVTAPPPYAPEDSKPATVILPSVSPVRTSEHQAVVSAPQSVPDHILRLRRKYGILPNTHPFTYRHVRTLHRMLNSSRSTRPSSTSIIPSSGPLPEALQQLVGTSRTNELDQHFVWTEKLAHVVDSYTSLLLPEKEIKRLEKWTTKAWGDEEAQRYRGRDSKGRCGDDVVLNGDENGVIDSSWIAKILEGICFKEEMNERKRRIAEMMKRAGTA